jgi:hypothetical protein
VCGLSWTQQVTKKNRYPLSLILGLLEQLGSAKIFTKIDLKDAYNLVQVKEGDEWKTTFRTRYGHFEYEHHVHLVLKKLRERGLYAKQDKCLFHQSMVEFLGYIVSGNGISIDRKKIQTIVDWIAPSSVRDV